MNFLTYNVMVVCITILLLLYSMYVFTNLFTVIKKSEIKASIRYLWVILMVMIGGFLVAYIIFYGYLLTRYSMENINQPFVYMASGLGLVGAVGVSITSKIFHYSLIGLADHQRKLTTFFQVINNARADMEKIVNERDFRLAVQSEQMSRQHKAVLNVLEDVSLERDKTRELANDLKKFELAVDNASDHIVITDINGVVLYANKAVEKTTGFTLDRVIGKKHGTKELWGGQMSKSFYNRMWHTVKSKKQTFTGEIKNKRKDGHYYYALSTISPVLDENKNILYFVCIERDITKLKEIDEAKTEFVSLASHQLRTPLSSVNWITEMILAKDIGQLNEKQQKYMELVHESNQRMIKLVEDLLNVSRIELGKFVPQPEQIILKSLIDDIYKELESRIKQKKITFEKDVVDKNYKLSADPMHLRMILQNLLSNAVKYTPSKGSVTLTTRSVNAGDVVNSYQTDRESVLITISDTGYGIPESDKDNIFNKLFRAKNVIERESEGTGLGLYLVKSLVTKVGGRVWFSSKENAGSTFYVLYPKKIPKRD